MRIAAIGECMIELSLRGDDGLYRLGFGGDTLNTAVYMARLGLEVDYCTALGDDAFSDRMIDLWRAEGVGIEQVIRLPGRLPGLYLIETERGERRFHYWRQAAPARDLFALPDTARLIEALARYRLIYLSGITLSLYGEAGREVLIDALVHARRRGAKVAFDPNYRPRGWPSAQDARHAMAEVLPLVDIALMGLDDERALYGAESADDVIRRLTALGVDEIVVKMAGDGAFVTSHAAMAQVPATPVPEPLDTTAAGDSFNAAYLAARLAGLDQIEAAEAGNRLAAAVIRHPGAIIPRTAMPGFSFAPRL